MKQRLVFTLAAMLVAGAANAGDRVGNGGGIWACHSSLETHHPKSAELVDLFEAREEFGWTVEYKNELTPEQIVAERLEKFKAIPKAYAIFQKSLQTIQSKIHFSDSEMVVVNDALYRIKPPAATCQIFLHSWTYIQFANYTQFDKILIQKRLWMSPVLSSTDKAALIWHEALYLYLRTKFGDENSIRARMLVGIVFSNMNAEDSMKEMKKVLGQPLEAWQRRLEARESLRQRNPRRPMQPPPHSIRGHRPTTTYRQPLPK